MSDKYCLSPDNQPPKGKESVIDAKGEKLLSEPGKSSSKYNNDEHNSCDDSPKEGKSFSILED
jgi:hypothetical protein